MAGSEFIPGPLAGVTGESACRPVFLVSPESDSAGAGPVLAVPRGDRTRPHHVVRAASLPPRHGRGQAGPIGAFTRVSVRPARTGRAWSGAPPGSELGYAV